MKADKKLGQHFLADKEARQHIASLILANAADKHVLEIGSGMGAISSLIFPSVGKKMTCIELDKRCVEYLQAMHPSLNILHEDFITSNYLEVLGEEVLVCGNFPYNISTEIVFRVLKYHEKVPVVIGMFQKEVAQRLAATSGSKIYGITSVLTQFFYEIKIELVLPPSAFSPPPKVESAVITMRRKKDIAVDISFRKLSLLVKTAFNQRRKMLRNALKSLQLPDVCIEKYGVMRAEQLTLEDYCAITKMMR